MEKSLKKPVNSSSEKPQTTVTEQSKGTRDAAATNTLIGGNNKLQPIEKK